ncbi:MULTISPECIES: OB-fold nucleic acid binding domain-containing protein [Thermococcus]|uniref:Replication protein RepA n=1 Tax=Thermococcus barossii TaxID=54077 RepID=A0A2Z2MEA6_9EURY|nr:MULTISPECIES: OB-fold nucleic acid binding domain-containing protein [Thermococcus]ASJ03923.1 replication protein RepA [Thermococcus barossii]NJE77180.1 replication protein RepA [Thermococcus sp. ES12]
MKKRLPASRVYLRDIIEGYYVKSEGDFEPNYLITKDARKVYRVKVVATVVRDPMMSEDESYGRFQIDDGTGTMWVFGFRENTRFINLVKKGDLVQIIGKIGEWRDDKQILVEGVAKVEPNMWILHRFETLKEKAEHAKKAKIAFEIYDRYGITAKAKVIAKNKGVSEDMLMTIDELYTMMLEQRSTEEALFEEEVVEEEPKAENPELEKAKKAVLDLLREKGKALSHKFIVKKLSKEIDEELIEEAITQLLAEGEIYEPEIGYYEPL